MNKVLLMLVAVLMITLNNSFAQETGAAQESTAVVTQESAAAAVEVGNVICPLSGRELNLNDANDYTKLEVQGYVFNVCPKAKTEYDNNPSQYESKINEAITAAASSATDNN